MPHAPERLRTFARDMRKAPTRGESRVWTWLRDRRFGGYKFRRQVPMDGFILDFYCAELRIAIEIDGAHHEMPLMDEYDELRTARLQWRGIEVVRISNDLLIHDPESAADCIEMAISRRK